MKLLQRCSVVKKQSSAEIRAITQTGLLQQKTTSLELCYDIRC